VRKFSALIGFVAGMASGIALYHAALTVGKITLVSQQTLQEQQSELAGLRKENSELTEELFRPRDPLLPLSYGNELPYDGDEDASGKVQAARKEAVKNRQFLMVTFGANWCRDCRNLHLMLHSPEVERYTEGLFHFVNVDVGKFNQNRHVAEGLGVDLSRGIPVAIFFDPEGRLIGTTNEGQLEPARHYTSRQILKFMRGIAERSRISMPDGVD
jgi:protein disulfide-isomerase